MTFLSFKRLTPGVRVVVLLGIVITKERVEASVRRRAVPATEAQVPPINKGRSSENVNSKQKDEQLNRQPQNCKKNKQIATKKKDEQTDNHKTLRRTNRQPQI